ncbi:MAG: hypothetical protein P8076_12660 [Gammaproteobacteria bacterium]
MMRWLWLLSAVAALPVSAAGWQFSAPLAVTGPARPGVFQHLESAGRRNLAVGADSVALVWEDNRGGAPQVYVAFKADQAKGFSAPLQVSAGREAYEPAVAAVADGFVVAWEQDGRVWMRRAAPGRLGPARQLDSRPSSQATLAAAADGSRLYAAWVYRDGRARHVAVSRVRIDGGRLQPAPPRPADARAPHYDQLYPSVAVSPDSVTVAWEDRREGHTRLYFTYAETGGDFAPLHPLNALLRPRSRVFGRGTGVTRVALDANARGRVAAVWMDKRHFRGGYDVYAAVSDDGGRHFGPNELAQDMFGDNNPQWHPAVAVAPSGLVVAAWDDPRDGTPDVWLSWRNAGGWSDDLAVPGASGPGAQRSPVLAFDPAGRLHIAWVARAGDGGTRIFYSVGHFGGE